MTLVYSIACGPAYEPFSQNVPLTSDCSPSWGDCLMQGPCKPSSNDCVKPRQRPAKAPRVGTDPFQTLYNSGHVAFDVLEKKEAFELVADAPGFDVSDILVELHDKVLIVAGNRQQQQPQQQGEQPTATAAQQQKAEAAAGGQKAEAAAAEHRGEQQQQASTSPKGSPKGLKKGFLVKSPPASQPPSQPSSQPASQPSSPKPQQAAPQQPQQPQPAATAAAQEQEPAKVWRRERRVQPFIRAFALPDNVEPEGITASLDKGVLTVRVAKLPEPPKPQPRRIAVRSAA